MNDYDDSTYGDRIAAAYDELYPAYDPASIELLIELARDGPTLELGIGTGRIAIPLHEEGVEVQGIDASEAMLSKLRPKKGGEEIDVVAGSFAKFEIDRSFHLIYVVFNTFFALLSQEEQVQCFQIVGDHLSPDGVFLMEAFVPDMNRIVNHQSLCVVSVVDALVQVDVSQHDPVTRRLLASMS